MQSAVTRKSKAGKDYNLQDDDLRIEVIDALKAYTINAAWQLMMDDKIGSIEVGKKADLVVLSSDPLNIPPDQLGTVKALAMYRGVSQTAQQLMIYCTSLVLLLCRSCMFILYRLFKYTCVYIYIIICLYTL